MENKKIVALEDARKNGQIRYFTGKPCIHEHIAERYVSTRVCCECGAERGRSGYAARKSMESTDKLYIRALEIYEICCDVCGIDNPLLLEWHHVNGRSHNKNDDSKKLVRRIAKANRRLSEYKLLCANCHRLEDIKDNTGIKGKRMLRLSLRLAKKEKKKK